MIQFINGIILSIDFSKLDTFWDDYLPIYYQNLDCEEFDSEENLPSHIQIFYYLNLFLCDFIFFFVTNFCHYDTEKQTFTNQFSYFEEFLKFSVSIMFYSCRNITNLFVFSEKKRKFLEIECEKTEYSNKESFNHYGLSLAFYLILNKDYTLYDFVEFKDTKRSLIPLVLSKEYLFSIYQSALLMIVRTENNHEFRFMKEYQKFSCDFLDLICQRLEAKTEDDNHSLLLFELLKFDKESVNIKKYLNCFVMNKEKILPDILKLTNKSSEISKILKIFNGFNTTIEEEGLVRTLRTLALNASIINEDIQKSLKNLITLENKQKINLLIEELKAFNPNEEYTMFIRFKEDIINSLENLI